MTKITTNGNNFKVGDRVFFKYDVEQYGYGDEGQRDEDWLGYVWVDDKR